MTGVDLKEFALFPKLPIELRSKIWKLAIIPRLASYIFKSNRSI